MRRVITLPGTRYCLSGIAKKLKKAYLISLRKFYIRFMIRTHFTLYTDRATVVVNGQKNHAAPPPCGSGVRMHSVFSGTQRTKIVRASNWLLAQGEYDFVTFTFPNVERLAHRYAPVRVKYFPDEAGNEVELENGAKLKGTRQKRVFLCGAPCTNVINDTEARRRLKAAFRSLGCQSFLWVAEVQPGRLRNHNQRAIHFHCMLPRLDGSLEARQNAVNDVWRRVQNLAGDFPQEIITDVRECTGTPGAYLAKYIAKGADEDEGLLPLSMWIQGNGYGMSHDVSAALKPVAYVAVDASGREEFADFIQKSIDYRVQDGALQRIDSKMYTVFEFGINPEENCQLFWSFMNFGISSGKFKNV